jgi:hypothetical protein
MAEITDKELEALQDGFDTVSLIQAVDELDQMRGHLNDRAHHNPPEIRNDILKLHDLAMDVVNHGMKGRAPALFELVIEIEDELSDLSTALENIQETIAKLIDLQPESLQGEDLNPMSRYVPLPGLTPASRTSAISAVKGMMGSACDGEVCCL